MSGGEVKAAYYGMVSLIDDNIGRILAALKEQGIEDDTLIMSQMTMGSCWEITDCCSKDRSIMTA